MDDRDLHRQRNPQHPLVFPFLLPTPNLPRDPGSRPTRSHSPRPHNPNLAPLKDSRRPPPPILPLGFIRDFPDI